MTDSRRNVRYMPNGNKPPAAIRISEEAAPALDEGLDEQAAGGAGGFELTGEAHQAFKDMLGHECKVGDKYTLEVTATAVTPQSTTFSLDNVESEYEEAPAEEAAPAPARSSKTPAMTYA